MQLLCPVADETGLSGLFDMSLDFMPASQLAAMTARGVEIPDAEPALAVAIQQQLGLKLEPRKTPIQTLIIDHIEKAPTEN